MTEQQIQREALALKSIRHSEGFEALEALLERKKRELFEQWASSRGDAGKSREWCNGYLTALNEVVTGVDEMIGHLPGQPAKKEDIQRATGTLGFGRGDLAT